jgi:5'-nucleotidase (lipoprotein e(P4) family)
MFILCKPPCALKNRLPRMWPIQCDQWMKGEGRRSGSACSLAMTLIWIGLTAIGCKPEPSASLMRQSPSQGETASEPSRLVQASSAEPVPKPHEDLDATLWMRTSAEYRVITKAIYRMAAERLEEALADPTWSAIPGIRTDPITELPPAVIVDVDETVLDNSGYQVQLIQNGGEYVKNEWQDFVALEASTAIPGAEEFLDACRAAGVKVFFVTNREASMENHTRANLTALDLLSARTDADEDTVLCKSERDEWKSDKTTRRAHVAQSYRVLLLIGDDLNDFLSVGDKPTSGDRKTLASQHDEYWGRKWIPLPNANYGGWERALYYFQDALPHETKLRKKREALVPTGVLEAAGGDGA